MVLSQALTHIVGICDCLCPSTPKEARVGYSQGTFFSHFDLRLTVSGPFFTTVWRERETQRETERETETETHRENARRGAFAVYSLLKIIN